MARREKWWFLDIPLDFLGFRNSKFLVSPFSNAATFRLRRGLHCIVELWLGNGACLSGRRYF